MPTYLTPGVYFERPKPQTAPLPQRTDVAGFVGLAERGSLHQPQRLTTWRQFQQVFGGFLPYSYLAYAVHAFFENGGQACWVVRIADEDAADVASLEIPDDSEDPSIAYRVEATEPGTWGNSLSVSVQPARLAASQHVAIEGLADDQLAAMSIAGFEAGSQVQLTQQIGESSIQVTGNVVKVDAVRGLLKLDFSLPDAGLVHDDSAVSLISIESLEFTMLVWRENQLLERFDNVAPTAIHSRYVVDIIEANSRSIRIERGAGKALPQLPWRGNLTGGANGLQTLNIFDYIGTHQGDRYGLAALATIDEVSILAIPDLTAKSRPSKRLSYSPRRRIDECALESPELRLTVEGEIVDAETKQLLAGVRIEVDDGLKISETETDTEGRFRLENLFPSSFVLLFALDGYEEQAYPVAIVPSGSDTQNLGQIALTPVDLPPSLNEIDVFYGQAAMVAQCEQLRDRIALIDPPLDARGETLDLSGLQSWRARFDSAFAVLYYPWLAVRDPLQPNAPQGLLVPPSGHVAGVYAATDLAEGVFRPPANKVLTFVEDIAVEIDDALQGVLNPQGINAIRAFPGRGIRIYGARTLSSNSAWRFVNVRRLMSMLEEAIHTGLQWAVFEPNDPSLQFGIRLSLIMLLDGLWRRGAFVGDTADAAYRVRCDAVTTPPDLQAKGQIVAEVSVAPTVPYEFIVLRLGLTNNELQISEV